jgi:porphobilinogen deaminase
MQGVAYHEVLEGDVHVAIHQEKDMTIEGVPDVPHPVVVVGVPEDEGEAEVSGLREGACGGGGLVRRLNM